MKMFKVCLVLMAACSLNALLFAGTLFEDGFDSSGLDNFQLRERGRAPFILSPHGIPGNTGQVGENNTAVLGSQSHPSSWLQPWKYHSK